MKKLLCIFAFLVSLCLAAAAQNAGAKQTPPI